MKKIIFLGIFVITFCSANSQNFAAPMCTCTPPSNSTCTADCLFSSCCVCWNPNSQSGACGCYWGVATCRNENNNYLVSTSNFGKLSPDAKIKFSFENFSMLLEYFRSNSISADQLQSTFLNVKSRYQLTGQKIQIDNNDFAQILIEYSKLIDTLTITQKDALNKFIKSKS